MSGTSNRLDHRILAEYEFILRDEVITQLLSFIECHIMKECTDIMIIFNNQCYDKPSWKKYLATQDEYNLKRQNSGYGPLLYDRLSDPIIGRE